MNLEKIKTHNEEASKGLHTFTLAENQLIDLVSHWQLETIFPSFRLCIPLMRGQPRNCFKTVAEHARPLCSVEYIQEKENADSKQWQTELAWTIQVNNYVWVHNQNVWFNIWNDLAYWMKMSGAI